MFQSVTPASGTNARNLKTASEVHSNVWQYANLVDLTTVMITK